MASWIFTHGDGDGLCAGAIALAADMNAKVFFTHPYGLLEDLGNVNENDRVIICDIALSENRLEALMEKFSEIADGGGLTYIDHHPLPDSLSIRDIPGKVVHRPDASASELAYWLFRDQLSHGIDRLAIIGAVSDFMDGTSLIHSLLCNWDKRTVYFETGVLVQGIEGRKRDYDFKRQLIAHLATGGTPSGYEGLVKAATVNTEREEEVVRDLEKHIRFEGGIAYVINYPFSLGKTATYARAIAQAAVGIAGEGRGKMIDMSLRTCRRDLDLNRMLRKIAPKLGGSGGGHLQAAGARIPEERFAEFIKELKSSINEAIFRASTR